MVSHDGDFTEGLIVWTSHGDGGREYLALFNLKDAEVRVEVPLARYGFTAEKYAARDVWEKKDLGARAGVSVELPAHGSVLLALRR